MKKIFLSLVIAMMAISAMAEKKTVQLYIPGMECANCQAKVENVLNYEKGVKKLNVTLDKRMVEITFDDTKTSVETLKKALLNKLKFKSMEMKDGKPVMPEHKCSGECHHNHAQGEMHHHHGEGEHHHHDGDHKCSGECHNHAHHAEGEHHHHEGDHKCSGECKSKPAAQGEHKCTGECKSKPAATEAKK